MSSPRAVGIEATRAPDADLALDTHIPVGDAAAFEAMFRTQYARLHAFIWHRTGSRSAAEELVQELFLRIWREVRGGTTTYVTREYLYRGAQFRILDYLKRRRLEERWQSALDDDSARTPAFSVATLADASSAHDAQALANAATDAIGRMPPRCRQIYLLCRQDGLSYAEIARVLDISVNTVKVQMGRALSALRTSLAPFLALVPIIATWRP